MRKVPGGARALTITRKLGGLAASEPCRRGGLYWPLYVAIFFVLVFGLLALLVFVFSR